MDDNSPADPTARMSMTMDMLQGLSAYPSVFVKQRRKGWCFELFCCETKSEYRIAGGTDQDNVTLYAVEESAFLCRACCPVCRPLEISVTVGADGGGAEMLHIERPFRLPCGFACCCHQQASVYTGSNHSSPGVHIGDIIIPFYCIFPTLDLYLTKPSVSKEQQTPQEQQQQPRRAEDMVRQYTYISSSPACCDCGNTDFRLYDGSARRSDVGSAKDLQKVIHKEWGGCWKELFTDADTFRVEFPDKSTNEQRALLLASTFLIDYNFYENSSNSLCCC